MPNSRFRFRFFAPSRFVFSLRVAIFALFTAMQQTILLRVNNCNNLGLIDARCNAEVSPPAAVRVVHAEAFVQLLTTFWPRGKSRRGQEEGQREGQGEAKRGTLFFIRRWPLPLDELLDKSYLHVVIYDFAVKMRCEIFAARSLKDAASAILHIRHVVHTPHSHFIYLAVRFKVATVAQEFLMFMFMFMNLSSPPTRRLPRNICHTLCSAGSA